MLHIIILILKIIGFLALAVFGLLLLLVLTVLLVPVRYSGAGAYCGGKPKGWAKVTWLLHILSVKAAYEESLSVTVRILGFRLSQPERTTARKAKKKRAPKRRKHKKNDSGDEGAGPVGEAQPFPGPVAGEAAAGIGTKRLDGAEEHPPSQEIPDAAGKAGEENSGSAPAETAPPKTRGGIVQRIWLRLKAAAQKIFTVLRGIWIGLLKIKAARDQAAAWFKDPENRRMLKLIGRQVRKVLRHLLPVRGQVRITFGFDDPYTTGQLLQALSLIYPFCHRQLEIHPVFGRRVMEAEGNFRGRIRLGTLLLCALRVYGNKNFRVTLKRVMR